MDPPKPNPNPSASADCQSDVEDETRNETIMEASSLQEIVIHKAPTNIIDEPSTSYCHLESIPSTSTLSEQLGDKKQLYLFTPDQLRDAFIPTLRILYKSPESLSFRQPIDSKNPLFHDYYVIIKNPMDLSTIKQKLESRLYKEAWDFVDDVWTMINNAWFYYTKDSSAYGDCTTLSEIFKDAIDPVMESLGYCCGRDYTFNPKVRCCYKKERCIIQNDDMYYSYESRYNICKECFEGIPNQTVKLSRVAEHEILITKDQFQYMKINCSEYDRFIYCKGCGRKFHKICVLYLVPEWPHGYICSKCEHKKEAQKNH